MKEIRTRAGRDGKNKKNRVKNIDQGFLDISLLSLRHVRNHFADKYQELKQAMDADTFS